MRVAMRVLDMGAEEGCFKGSMESDVLRVHWTRAHPIVS
jgi:hypothetical protein